MTRLVILYVLPSKDIKINTGSLSCLVPSPSNCAAILCLLIDFCLHISEEIPKIKSCKPRVMEESLVLQHHQNCCMKRGQIFGGGMQLSMGVHDLGGFIR